MTTTHPNYAALVAAIGQALYGTTWAEHLSRDLGVAKRGIERTKAAAVAGDDYASAKGYLDGLQALLRDRQIMLEGLGDQLQAAINHRAAARSG